MPTIDKTQLDQIISLIVTEVEPDQIILFGSHARGVATEKSDIDLLVTKKGLENERKVSQRLEMTFWNHKIAVPIDLLAIDTDKYKRLYDDVGYIYHTIKREGKVLYGKL